MNCFRSRARPLLAAAVLLLLPLAAVLAQDGGGGEASESDAWFDRALAQGEGLRTDWAGSVVGDVTARIGGRAKMHFVELENGRLRMQLYLGDDHQYYDGVSLGGTISCARGTRTYPVWVRRSVGEDQPFGQLELWYTDGRATVSNRIGVSPPPGDDHYSAEFGRVTVTLLEDRLAVSVDALMSAGPIREGSIEVNPRIQLRAQVRAERTLENERLFDTSRCEGRAPFEVVSVKPEDGRANVLEDDPEILVELSEDVHPESLENPDLIVVRTLRRSPEGAPGLADDESAREAAAGRALTPVPFALGDESPLEERVAGSIELKEPNVLRFVPDAPLRTGVRYQIDLATGDDGIRSQDFHVLEHAWPRWFTTRVKPDEVRMNVYQTTRDAPLILRKPAMARVYLDWQEDLAIDPDWQVKQAQFDIEITRNDERRAVMLQESHWVQRPDQYDDEDLRLARDSVNRFGWTTRGKDVRRVVARVRPHDPYPAKNERELPEDIGARDVQYADRQVDDLTVEAWIMRLGEWRDEPPAPETVGAAIRGFQLDNEYARQVYPFVHVRGYMVGMVEAPHIPRSADEIYRGSLSPARKLDFDQVARNYATLEVQSRILHDHYAAFSAADIVVGYYPPELGEGRGQGIVKYPWQRANVVLMPVMETDWSRVPSVLVAPLVAHEYGHVFGLEHVQRVNREERSGLCSSKASYLQPSEGIEGFRILAGGERGHSKSSTTGNGEKAESLKDLMFPCMYDPRAMWWISDSDYHRVLVDAPGLLQGQRAARFADSRAQGKDDVSHAVLMRQPAPVQADGVRWMLVSGFTDGSDTLFLPAVGAPAPPVGPEPDSPYVLVVEDEKGDRLASRRVERLSQEGPGYFSAILAVDGSPARLLLLKDGQPVGELAAGDPVVAPRIVSHEAGAMLQKGESLRWRPAPDGAGALYSVRYHAGPNGPTRVLAALTNRTELPIDPDALPRGDAPAIEVIAHSGLHESSTRLRVQLPDTLRPMLVHPVGKVPADDEGDIGAWFPAELAPDSLNEGGVRLLDASGAEVPVRAFVDPNGSGVRILPQAALVPEAEYTVHLAPGLEALDGRGVSSAVRWSFRTAAASADAAVMDVRQLPLPRAVTPLPPLPGSGGAQALPAAAERATGEATMIGTDAMQSPVSFSVCESAQNPSARVLLDGRFGDDGAGVRFRLERAAGDTLVLSVERQTANGPLVARLQGSLARPGGSGLTVTEQQGHWNLSAMLDFEDGRKPVLMRLSCGLP